MMAGLVALRFSRGSGPVMLKKPYFCDFLGGPDPLSPSGSAHDSYLAAWIH